ncbi:SH3 domain-containing protein [uncultured Devosia sp.]|uniref:SH3 domain-containing protein n=1 Tax=uncultured Devosia sp. TaxID=211434 RepID=UPI00262F3FD5|nr:SH3 domain-containing protein [uncultured Devosia sp.]
MQLSKTLCAALGFSLVGMAAAQAAQSTASLNVRSGPSTSYRVVDVLYQGETVDVETCQSGWCRINHNGPDGWVSARYLTDRGDGGGQQDSGSGASVSGNARATAALNVRSGPGTGYRAIDVLDRGERVQVERCQSGWCRINHNGPDGWVSARYLSNAGGGGQQSAEPDVSFSFNVPGFSFSVGNGGDFQPRPGRPSGEVCFYEDYNYRGASFCAQPGDRDASLGSFNDRISSIRVRGDAQVQVCEDFNFNGRCAVLDRNRPSLQGRNNDIISSYRVR